MGVAPGRLAPAGLAFAVLLLAGCQREPSFDERYSAASRAVASSGAALDAELKAREQWRAAEDAAAVPASGKPQGGNDEPNVQN